MRKLFKEYINDVSGASAVEYALFFGLVGLAVIGGAKLFTNRMDMQWNHVDNTFVASIPKNP